MGFYDPLDDSGYDETATLEEESPRERRKRRGGPTGLFNLLSIVFFLISIGAIVGFVMIYRSPTPIALSSPPPTATLIPFPFLTDQPEDEATATPPEAQSSPPTATDAPPEPTATPTNTPAPTATDSITAGNATSTPSLFPFSLRDNAITYEQNQNQSGCDWLGIAGQVVDTEGNGVNGLPLQVTGPDDFEALVFSGSATGFGPGGFEVQLGSEPAEAEYRLQLVNTNGQPISEPIIVRTLGTCERNVAIAIFEQSENVDDSP